MISKNKIYLVLAIASIVIPIIFQNKQAAIGLGIVALFMIATDWSKSTIYLWFIVAILGGLAEAICIYFGVWHYAHPNFIGIPMWLPIVWGNAGLAIYRLGRTL